MFKQSDKIILLAIFAAVVGILVLTSGTATLVIVAALALVFGGLIGTRLQNIKVGNQDTGDADQATGSATQPSGADATTTDANPAHAVSGSEAAGSSTVPQSTQAKRGEEAPTSTHERLLDNLFAAIPEGVGLKDLKGSYLTVNDAFARMLETHPSEIVGRDDAHVFGHLTAQSLLAADDAAATRGRIAMTMEVPLPNGPRVFEITKAAVSGDDDEVAGIAAVWRDITDVAHDRVQRDKAMREAILAFTKSIELRDPYLSDHAQRLAQLAAAVADEMNLDDDVATTVELAGYLSQIGKLGIDSQLLGQERRFTEQEIKEMQKHVHHTARLLRDMDFGLPVADALYQMNERLDGSGYPQGMVDRDIPLPARILAACDVFCARTSPRSYRPAIEATAALDILRQNPHRYDEHVVRALYRVVAPAKQEKLSA